MPLDVLLTTDRINRDPIGREFIDHLKGSAGTLGLTDAAIYYDFPAYADYETVSHQPDILLASRSHGVVALRLIDGSDEAHELPRRPGQRRCRTGGRAVAEADRGDRRVRSERRRREIRLIPRLKS